MRIVRDHRNDLHFLSGGGEMGNSIRSANWSGTPLGSPKDWPQNLRAIVSVMLDNPHAMCIAWGEELIQLYNDRYSEILRSTDLSPGVGLGASESFGDLWPVLEPLYRMAMQGVSGELPDFRLSMNREFGADESYIDFGFTPIRDDRGKVNGVLVIGHEPAHTRKTDLVYQESETRFKTLADSIPNLAWMANADGWIFWYNKKWYEYTGTTPEQMEGWGWQSVHDESELPKVLEQWKSSIASGLPFEMVFPLKGADGKFRQFLTRVLPWHDPQGRIQRWFGTNTDITRLVEAEGALKASEERFRTMAESADILIGVGDSTGKATYFNKAWVDLTGRPMSELIEFGWADLVHPGDRERYVDLYLSAFEKKVSFTGEFRVRDKHGEYRWLLAKAPPLLGADGSFHGYISSCIDITDQVLAFRKVEESEQDLRSMVLQAPIGICIMDGPTRVVEIVNDSFLEVAGKPLEAVGGKFYWDTFAEARHLFEGPLTEVVETGKTFYASEVEFMLIRHGREETIFVTFVFAPLKDSDGNVKKVACWLLENTPQVIARRRVEEMIAERTKELANTNKDLQKSNRELAQFAYIASHDLQEPLRKISTFSNMLERCLNDKLDAQARNYLDKINNSASRMNVLIRDVLTYSELVKANEVFVAVDLNTILENILSDYDLLIEQKRAVIDCGSLPVIEAIPLQMTQLFANLLGNALKFTRKDVRPVIRIWYEQLTPEQIKANPLLNESVTYISIMVKDNGIGFAEEYSEQIFNIFQRLHRKSEFQGTGIGLAMCKKIALNHHGDINARGSTGDGAVFNVFLPLRQMQAW